MASGLKSPLKRGDTVVVIAGKEKGKKGRILRVDTAASRVTVEGVNLVKRHQKATRLNQEAGIVTKEAGIHVSNVMLADPKSGEATRIGYKVLENGRKVRFAKKSGDVIDN
jgi:large subunit ribosomal protein L24